IEHEMLAKLKFKENMAAGVLDDGEDLIFMGSERFKEFMENVDRITQKVEGQPVDADAVTADTDLEDAMPGAAAVQEDAVEEPSLEEVEEKGSALAEDDLLDESKPQAENSGN